MRAVKLGRSVLAASSRHQQSRGLATPKELLMKITSTQGIASLTKSMKMVAAAKLRGTEALLKNGAAFGHSVDTMVPAAIQEEPYYEGLYEAEYPESAKTAIVVLSSDKGLCGGVNSRAAKLGKAVCDAEENAADLFIVGDKARGAISRTHAENVVSSVDECWKPALNFSKASAIAHRIVAAGEYEQVKIIYNQYVSVVAYNTTMQPVRIFSTLADPLADFPAPLAGYELEPEVPAEVMMNLSEYALAVKLFYGALENATSEESSRMNAMENATKNAEEMIERLTIQYNRVRQAKITTELIEIISGAEALNG